jgi:hypothetical protein
MSECQMQEYPIPRPMEQYVQGIRTAQQQTRPTISSLSGTNARHRRSSPTLLRTFAALAIV